MFLLRNIRLFLLGIFTVIQVECQKNIGTNDNYVQQCERSMNTSMNNFLDEIREINTTLKAEELAIAKQMDKTLRKAINSLVDTCRNDSFVPADHASARIEGTNNSENIHQITLQRYDVELGPEPKSPEQTTKDRKRLKKPLEVKPMKPRMNKPTSEVDNEFSVYFKRQFVRDIMKFAWRSYRNSTSWGYGQLKFGKTPGKHRWSYDRLPFWDMGATIVTSLDTLIIMDLLDEYKEGRDWIKTNLTLNGVSDVLSVRRILIGYIGGLLSCYTFSGDEMFKEKALHIAEYLLRSYKNSKTGLPSDWYLLGAHEGPIENTDENITEMPPSAAVSLEFDYLSEITGIKKFGEKNQIALGQTKSWFKQTLRGLLRNNFLMHFPTESPTIYREAIARSDGHYLDYLLKSWIRGGLSDSNKLGKDFIEAAEYASSLIQRSKDNLVFVGLYSEITQELKNLTVPDIPPSLAPVTEDTPISNNPSDDNQPSGSNSKKEIIEIPDIKEERMAFSSCYLGGMFAIASTALNSTHASLAERYLILGTGIANTCYEAHLRAVSKLAPAIFGFPDDTSKEAKNNIQRNPELFTYQLSSAAAETYFYLWRVTHNITYRKWGWELANAIKLQCNTKAGYAGKLHVDEGIWNDGQQHSVFLSETLKYLYLLFSDDDVLPLDEWIFNANAHAFPIQGTHAHMYSVYEASD